MEFSAASLIGQIIGFLFVGGFIAVLVMAMVRYLTSRTDESE